MTRTEKVKALVEQLLSENRRSDSMKKSYQRRRDQKAVGSKFKPGKTEKVKMTQHGRCIKKNGVYNFSP